MARVVGINRSVVKGVSKDGIAEGLFIAGFGLEGDAHAGNWHRQVSFLGVESIKKIDPFCDPRQYTGKFAENITTEGICLYELETGCKIRAGEVLFEVTQIGKDCHSRCEIFELFGDCIMPREGVFAKVLTGGIVKIGDEIFCVKE